MTHPDHWETKECGDYPEHWGQPPKMQTKDLRSFPRPYHNCKGSGTVARWIAQQQRKDKQGRKAECGVYPSHWGSPPLRQTRDRRQFPAPWDHCYGSGTVVKWIKEKQKEDAASKSEASDKDSVTLSGVFQEGIMAIGGETTGVILKTGDKTYELILSNEQKQSLSPYNGKTIKLEGIHTTLQGVERGKRAAFKVTKLLLEDGP